MATRATIAELERIPSPEGTLFDSVKSCCWRPTADYGFICDYHEGFLDLVHKDRNYDPR